MSSISKTHPPKRTEKLQLMLDDHELGTVDDWWFRNRMPTRAAAIREFIRRGLEVRDEELGETGEERASSEFRIVDPQEARRA